MARPLKKQFAPKGKIKEVSDYRKMLRPEVNIEKELGELAKKMGIKPDAFMVRADGVPARLMAYHHLVVNCGLKQTLVADYFKVSIHAVSKGIRRLDPEIFSRLPLKKLRGMSNVEV